MQTITRFITVSTLCFVFAQWAWATGSELGLYRAEQLALANDPVLQMLQSRALSHREQSVAADTLADPRLKVGIMNLPADGSDASLEPMSQLQLGIQQHISQGAWREANGEKMQALSRVEESRAHNRERQLRQLVRHAWYDWYYQAHAKQTLAQSLGLFKQLVEITQDQYATGRGKQQDVIRAQLELSLLEDRELRIVTALSRKQAALEKWVGQGDYHLPKLFATLGKLPAEAESESRLLLHPLLQAAEAGVAAGESQLGAEQAKYAPDWMFELNYGQRQLVTRPDLFSAMISVSLPLFTANRQDRKVSASRAQLQGKRYQRDEQLRELQRLWQADAAAFQHLTKRLALYEQKILEQSAQNSVASLKSYQAGVSDFTVLMRARLMELNSQLQWLEVRVEHAKVQANLLYLVGDQ